MAIKKQESTEAAIFGRLDKISTAVKKDWHAGFTMKLAVAQFWADQLGLKDKEREEAIAAFMETPTWFGCNASQARQAREKKSTPSAMASYVGI